MSPTMTGWSLLEPTKMKQSSTTSSSSSGKLIWIILISQVISVGILSNMFVSQVSTNDKLQAMNDQVMNLEEFYQDGVDQEGVDDQDGVDQETVDEEGVDQEVVDQDNVNQPDTGELKGRNKRDAKTGKTPRTTRRKPKKPKKPKKKKMLSTKDVHDIVKGHIQTEFDNVHVLMDELMDINGASFHLTLPKNSLPKQILFLSHLSQTINWTATTDHSHLQEFTLDLGFVNVPKNGYYYIYSHVTYHGQNAGFDFPGPGCEHQVLQTKNSSVQTLMSSTVTQHNHGRPQAVGNKVVYPVDTATNGGVFFLSKGDKLSVKITELTKFCWVMTDEATTYFGGHSVPGLL